jgi:hypothetical protein
VAFVGDDGGGGGGGGVSLHYSSGEWNIDNMAYVRKYYLKLTYFMIR